MLHCTIALGPLPALAAYQAQANSNNVFKLNVVSCWMSLPFSPQTPGLDGHHETHETVTGTVGTQVFSETLAKLWEVHTSELQGLQLENERLLAKVRLLEGVEALTSDADEKGGKHQKPEKPASRVHVVRSAFSDSSDDSGAKPHAEARPAWMPVVTSQSPNGMFEQTRDRPSSFWLTAKRITKHPMFDIVVAGIIFLNTIVMAIEAQWEGLSVGASINYGTVDASHTTTWESAEQTFVWIGVVFGLIYIMELILKLVGQRGSFFRQFFIETDVLDRMLRLCGDCIPSP